MQIQYTPDKGKLSTLHWRHMGEWRYSSTHTSYLFI
jgi:hypothetical protein